MSNLKVIRKRITSVKSTQQITRAMKMVAAAKLRRAQDAATEARAHSDGIEKILTGVVKRSVENDGPPPHPLLENRKIRKAELLVITSDRGLCGGFNSNILKRANLFIGDIADKYEITVTAVGRKGRDYFKRRPHIRQGNHHYGVYDSIDYEWARKTSEDYMQRYLAEDPDIDAVFLLYNRFISVINQKVTLKRLIPLEPPERSCKTESLAAGQDYRYEPDRDTVLDSLLPAYLSSQVWRAILESIASEHAARMTAMDSATRNAGEMIDSLTLLANRTRQAAITTELVEIVSGAEAL